MPLKLRAKVSGAGQEQDSLGSRLRVEGKESQKSSNGVMSSGENKKGRRRCSSLPTQNVLVVKALG